jgi:nucleotide-binding universal stress UspA family protein
VHLSRPGQCADEERAARAGDERYLELLASPRREARRDVRVAVLDGSVALAISDYADRVNADVIVMTTHGRTGDERRRLGSVAAVVAHHATCPVMLARAGERTGNAPFDHIVVAVDGTEQPEAVTSVALQLGSLGHPAFRIVHTLAPARALELIPAGGGTARPEHTRAEDHVAGIAGRLRAAGLRAEVLVTVTESPAHAIGAAARQESADLIVLPTRLDAASPTFAPSLAEAVLQQWPSPVLLLKQM